MFEYTFADTAAQSAAQPLILTLWLRWLLLINFLPALIFIRHTQARWTLAALLIMLAINTPLSLMFGFGKVLALPHLLVWIPLLAYLAQEWKSDRLSPAPAFRIWIAAVMATNLISVVFDVRDSALFLSGDHAPTIADPTNIPYITFAVIIVSLGALVGYLRVPSSHTTSN